MGKITKMIKFIHSVFFIICLLSCQKVSSQDNKLIEQEKANWGTMTFEQKVRYVIMYSDEHKKLADKSLKEILLHKVFGLKDIPQREFNFFLENFKIITDLEIVSEAVTDISGITKHDKIEELFLVTKNLKSIKPLKNKESIKRLEIFSDFATDIEVLDTLTSIQSVYIKMSDSTDFKSLKLTVKGSFILKIIAKAKVDIKFLEYFKQDFHLSVNAPKIININSVNNIKVKSADVRLESKNEHNLSFIKDLPKNVSLELNNKIIGSQMDFIKKLSDKPNMLISIYE